jgi:predicted Zn-ribbon and HTH transcriptional regulator
MTAKKRKTNTLGVALFVQTIQRQRDAAEMQPWRCAQCGTAVRRGYNDPCKCFATDPIGGERA